MSNKTGAKYLVFLMAVFSSFFLGCAADNRSVQVKEPGQASANALKVGVSTNSPPLIYKQQGKVTGLEAALAKKFAESISRPIEFVEVPWSKQLEYLNQGKTDIVMSGMTITKARSYLADFTKPYLQSGQIMLVRLKDINRFSTGISSVMNTGYRVGTVKGTTGDLFVTSTISKVNKRAFKTSAEAVEALIKEEIDVFVYDAPMVCHYAALHQADKLVPVLILATREHLAWAVNKNNKELEDKANRFIESISASGELKSEINKWIPYLNR